MLLNKSCFLYNVLNLFTLNIKYICLKANLQAKSLKNMSKELSKDKIVQVPSREPLSIINVFFSLS